MLVPGVYSKKLVKSVHDISSGGILVTLSEMCITSNIGATIKVPKKNIKLHEYFFGEDQSRYIIEVMEKNIEKVSKILKDNSIYFNKIGKTQKGYLDVKNEFKVSIKELGKLHKHWFNGYFKENIWAWNLKK